MKITGQVSKKNFKRLMHLLPILLPDGTILYKTIKPTVIAVNGNKVQRMVPKYADTSIRTEIIGDLPNGAVAHLRDLPYFQVLEVD